MNKAFCKWEEMLMEYILACSRQGSNSTTMEAINQGDDDMTTFTIFVMAIFTSCFDGTFIRLCTRVREEYLLHTCFSAQLFCQFNLWQRIVQIRDMVQRMRLLCYRLCPFIVIYTKGCYTNTRSKIDVFFTIYIP